jgi:hypothetical protein
MRFFTPSYRTHLVIDFIVDVGADVEFSKSYPLYPVFY